MPYNENLGLILLDREFPKSEVLEMLPQRSSGNIT